MPTLLKPIKSSHQGQVKGSRDDEDLANFLKSLLQSVRGGDPKSPLFIVSGLPKYLEKYTFITDDAILEVLDYVVALGGFDVMWERKGVFNPYARAFPPEDIVTEPVEFKTYVNNRKSISLLGNNISVFVDNHHLVEILKKHTYAQSWACPNCEKKEYEETFSRKSLEGPLSRVYDFIFERQLKCLSCGTEWPRPCLSARKPV